MFVNGSGRNEQTLYRAFHRCFLPSFALFSKAVSEEKIFKKSTNQKQELSVVAMFVYGSGRNEQSLQRTLQRCFQRSYGSFGQTFQRRRILKITHQKQESSVVAMFVNGSGRIEQSLQRTFHRCFLPSFGPFGQVVSEEKIFKNRQITQKQELPVTAMFVNGSGQNVQTL
jgi:hypothetical protein